MLSVMREEIADSKTLTQSLPATLVVFSPWPVFQALKQTFHTGKRNRFIFPEPLKCVYFGKISSYSRVFLVELHEPMLPCNCTKVFASAIEELRPRAIIEMGTLCGEYQNANKSSAFIATEVMGYLCSSYLLSIFKNISHDMGFVPQTGAIYRGTSSKNSMNLKEDGCPGKTQLFSKKQQGIDYSAQCSER